MKSTFNLLSIAAVSVLLSACNSPTEPALHDHAAHGQASEAHASQGTAAMAATGPEQTYKKGDHVPNELVCMVNNEFMGKKQLEVKVDGKTYYGCCKMCQERLPQDPKVRTALDPNTSKPVDKASAYIVIVGDNGEVAYFEGEESYHQFLRK